MYLVLQSTPTYVINYNKVAGYSEIAPFFILKKWWRHKTNNTRERKSLYKDYKK